MYSKKLLTCIIVSTISIVSASELKADENVLFIPDIAYQVTDNKIAINMQVWVYEKERRLGMTTFLTKYLGIDKDKLSPTEYELLYQRSQLFRVDSERNKEIKIKLPNNVIYSMPRTNKGGRSNQTIYIDATPNSQNPSVIKYQIYGSGTPASTTIGQSFFSPETGTSVISDIDDTIKDSHVLNKEQLLINTFIKPFKAIDSMRDWYQQMASQTINFHYISSSPIQLYPALKEFMDSAQFPEGSLYLREGTTWHATIPAGDDSLNHKLASIKKLLTAYPKRHFILIGDSGEADPEIYAQIMANYPNQIKCIAIRNVTDEDAQSVRYQQLFKEMDADKWQIFTDPKTINGTCTIP